MIDPGRSSVDRAFFIELPTKYPALDRSSGSMPLNINEDGFKFSHFMLGYFLMNDKQLDLDFIIQKSDGKLYMEIFWNDQVERLILTQLIKKQTMIANPGTRCWKAYRDKDQSKQSLIIKDSWQ